MGVKERFYVDLMAMSSEVTGSCNLIIAKFPDGTTEKGIVDCGLFQEQQYDELNSDFPFNEEEISFCAITHNHVDHTGRLPLLVRRGYRKTIYTTHQTACFLPLALRDSNRVLRDVSKRKQRPCLYYEEDVERTLELVSAQEYEKPIMVTDHIEITFFKNGHLIGAAIILVKVKYPGCEDINLLFTGDYNDNNMFFAVDALPREVKELPITVIQESTYGDMETKDMQQCFEDNVLNCIQKGGSVVIPVFSLGRAQEILYLINKMQKNKQLSLDIPVYFDGKLAIQYTRMYINAELGIAEEMKQFLPENLIYVTKEMRTSVVEDKGCKIIITTSGMGSYGPAQTYIPAYIQRENALIQFTGYTAPDTLGGRLKNTLKGEPVFIGGLQVLKRADVEYTTEFSAHAKADCMIKFLSEFNHLQLVLINHGQEKVKERFANRILREVLCKYVGILGKEYFFRIGHYGLIKTLGTRYK